MASGGADDRIFVYDLKSRQEHCALTHHSSTINCLRFTPNHTHLISGTADGSITMVRVGNWQIEKTWDKAHKGAAILDIAVHDSGKLALSLGSDCTLRTWNLVKGRQAYAINLNSKSKDAKSLTNIVWGPDGVKFILYGGLYTEMWSIDVGGKLSEVLHTSKVQSCLWLSEAEFVVGYENGQLGVTSVKDGTVKLTSGHSMRVRAICKCENWIVTAASNGEIKVWDRSFKELAKVDTGCRLTCLCVLPPTQVKKEEAGNSEEQEAESNEVTEVSDVETKGEPKKSKRKEVVIIEENDDGTSTSLGTSKRLKKKCKKKKKNSEDYENHEEHEASVDTRQEHVLEEKSKKTKTEREIQVEDVVSKRKRKSSAPRKLNVRGGIQQLD